MYTINGEPALQESIVAFIDVLGSSNLMRDLDNQSLRKFLNNIGANSDFFSVADIDDSPLHKVLFSDNVAIGTPIGVGDPFDKIEQVTLASGYFQMSMTLAGYPIRGGITSGPLFIDSEAVVGAGLVDAYRMEGAAEFPIIEIHHDLIESAFVLERSRKREVIEALSEQIIVMYDRRSPFPRFVVHYAGFFPETDEGLSWALEQHRTIIERGLLDHRSISGIRQKYEWMACYHNWNCIGLSDQSEYWLESPGLPTESVNPKFLTLEQYLEEPPFGY